MSDFDLLFSLFSLLMGLGMAEVLSDLGRVLDRRKRLRAGLLTPMLATVVLFDIGSFWISAFQNRTLLKADNLGELSVLLFAGSYYLIATIVIPEDLDKRTELDSHYWENRRIVVGGIALLNVVSNLASAIITGMDGALAWSIVAIFYGLLAGLLLVKSYRANVALLAGMILLNLLVPLGFALAGY